MKRSFSVPTVCSGQKNVLIAGNCSFYILTFFLTPRQYGMSLGQKSNAKNTVKLTFRREIYKVT